MERINYFKENKTYNPWKDFKAIRASKYKE
jgi:hypothetical protein